jgi:hypothetical protein
MALLAIACIRLTSNKLALAQWYATSVRTSHNLTYIDVAISVFSLAGCRYGS